MSSAVLHPERRTRARALSRAGLADTIVELPGAARTARAAADYLGCEIGQIANPWCFAPKRAMPRCSSCRRARSASMSARLAALAGEPVGKADADFVRRHTGFAIGGVAPVGHGLARVRREELAAYRSCGPRPAIRTPSFG